MGKLYRKVRRLPAWLCATGRGLKDMITAKDGETVAPSRVYWLAASAWSVIGSIYSTVALAQPFNVTDFGTGMGLVLTAGGVGVWITRKTEPE
jgi:hypothetical protein